MKGVRETLDYRGGRREERKGGLERERSACEKNE